MPRIGMEPQRREALIRAAIGLFGEAGSLDVPVKQIAERAGMSSALAFHYFGDKDAIVVETMRHLMQELAGNVRNELAAASTSRERLNGIVRASFLPSQFERHAAAAWLVFYLKAHTSKPAARLLSVYTNRLRSNLLHELKSLVSRDAAGDAADTLAALIDGIYIRQILRSSGPNSQEAIRLCQRFIDSALAAQNAQSLQMNAETE